MKTLSRSRSPSHYFRAPSLRSRRRAARARAECKVQQVGVERGAARRRGEANPRVACRVDGADRAHVERMGERRILFAVEEDAHVPSGRDEGNGVRLVVEKGAGPAGLVERALEQCVHVAAVDVQPDRESESSQARIGPSELATCGPSRRTRLTLRWGESWSASDGRMRRGQVEKYDASYAYPTPGPLQPEASRPAGSLWISSASPSPPTAPSRGVPSARTPQPVQRRRQSGRLSAATPPSSRTAVTFPRVAGSHCSVGSHRRT